MAKRNKIVPSITVLAIVLGFIPFSANTISAEEEEVCDNILICVIEDVNYCNKRTDGSGQWRYEFLGIPDPVEPGASYNAFWTIIEYGARSGSSCLLSGSYECTIFAGLGTMQISRVGPDGDAVGTATYRGEWSVAGNCERYGASVQEATLGLWSGGTI